MSYANSTIDDPFVTELVLGEVEVGHRGDNVTVELWREVVVNILSWVGPFLLGGGSSDLELVTDHAFSKFNRCEVIVNIVISAKVWN